ncbi:hypothetical protein Lal_00045995 [Lupinus albus]|nr:hypothetical protein Lal_00045995 [Lupinus albus]
MISNFGSWVEGKWVWIFTWRRQFFTWELELFNSFLDELKLAALQTNKSDSWEWRHDKSKMFTVRSAYSILTSHDQVLATPYNDSFLLWKSRVPLKVFSFTWRLFQNRIPTKDALLRQGFSSSDSGGILCPFCNEHPESTDHLFSSCSLSYLVWQMIYKWLGISVVLPNTPSHHLSYHLGLVKDRKSWKFWSVIWFATIWAIWLSRNDFIFNNVNSSLLHILDSAKLKSWLWIKSQRGLNSTIYSDWLCKPLECLSIVM